MAKTRRTFVAGKMNKVVDERLLPAGEYVDALNVRLGSTEQSEIGSVELSLGNTIVSNITFNGVAPSVSAKCIGAYADDASETIYWFIHDSAWAGNGGGSPVTTTILDMVVSYNLLQNSTTYHLISVQEGTSNRSTLNFSDKSVITGVNLVDGILLWTDNINPPRSIGINETFTPPTITAGVVTSTDNFSAEEIRVIVKPPFFAPTVNMSTGPTQFQFLTERLISFAYRYRYSNGEYSATSQFSDPAFIPGNFQFSSQSFLNEGMINSTNIANVTFNTGSSLVKGIELLWKDNDNGVIKIMERIDKAGVYADNVDVNKAFNVSKILTVLPLSEILRLYDNVPRFAQAQTLMGNRLIYGNYVENYDLKSADSSAGLPTNICYTSSLVSTEIGQSSIPTTLGSTTYTIGGISMTTPDSVLNLDLSSVSGNLNSGAGISITMTMQVSYVSGADYTSLGGTAVTNPPPGVSFLNNSSTPDTFEVSFDYVLPATFSGVDELVANPNFISQLGTNAAEAISNACSGATFTDVFNCSVPFAFNTIPPLAPLTVPPYGLYPSGYGISLANQGVTASSAGNTLQFIFPSIQYSQNALAPIGAESYQVAFRIISAQADFTNLAAPKSLHSNRGYEVGIVYMDAFKRATTAFTSEFNTVNVPCSASDTRNQIRVNIPTAQVAPWWADSYKFVIKPSATTYETIFSNIVFKPIGTSDAYILLEGENARKVEEGTRLIVKADLSGPLEDCRYVTVLQKSTQEKGFIQVPVDPEDPANTATVDAPAGVYMKIKASGFNLEMPPASIISTGYVCDLATQNNKYPVIKLGGFNDDNGVPYTIPAGSRIRFNFYFERKGAHGGEGACERRIYTYQPNDFFSGGDHPDIIQWWINEDIGSVIEQSDGDQYVGGGDCPIGNVSLTDATNPPSDDFNILEGTGDVCVNAWQWCQDPATQEIRFTVRGTRACAGAASPFGKKKRSKVCGEVTIFRASNLLIFETEPEEALPDVWYEGQDCYRIVDQNHLSGTASGDVNQDINLGVDGVVFLGNFNCYTFGNGCESYRIRDSINGRYFDLGNRVTTTASKDYGRAHRFADLTYSGVYNDESNINKLNEFNLGLVNFKPLEDSFGDIMKLVGRKNDILVLQEDKISYVLSGKNLLSDAVGGGAVTATPEVLGTQIARVEEYGISRNPESYAEFGYDKYFTDAKRGAVIKLSGTNYSSESLKVISEYGMRSWFRDLFNSSPNTLKFGGFDPYMNEYVLGTSDTDVPPPEQCLTCGGSRTYTPDSNNKIIFCSELDLNVGPVTILTSSVVTSIEAVWNGVTYSSAASNTLVFTKNAPTPTEITVTITTAIAQTVEVSCPVPTPLIIRRITINSPQYVNQTTHNQNKWTDAAISFTSNVFPANAAPSTILLDMPNSLTGDGQVFVTSQCVDESGFQGQGQFPTNGSVIDIMNSEVLGTDTFDFSAAQGRLGYYRGNTATSNYDCTNLAQLNTLLGLTTFPALNPEQVNPTAIVNSANAAMPVPTGGGGTDILYLVYDFRDSSLIDLCYTADSGDPTVDINDVCCQCSCTAQNTSFTLFTIATEADGTPITFTYIDTAGNQVPPTQLIPGVAQTICVNLLVPAVPQIFNNYGDFVDITINSCGCT